MNDMMYLLPLKQIWMLRVFNYVPGHVCSGLVSTKSLATCCVSRVPYKIKTRRRMSIPIHYAYPQMHRWEVQCIHMSLDALERAADNK